MCSARCPSASEVDSCCPCLQAFKHYSKYATQALKAANLPKNIKNMKGDVPMNPRNMQESIKKMGQVCGGRSRGRCTEAHRVVAVV